MTGVFRKERADAPLGFFEAEAAGLAWLRAAGGARVVRVLDVAPGRIELEQLDSARPDAAAARAFGAALAATHAAGAPAFGAPPEGWDGPCFIGRQELPTTPRERWGRFYAEQRVLPYLRRARDRGHVDARVADLVEGASEVLADGALDDDEPPARLHGDLWTGNVAWTRVGGVLIDPAAHGGHRETDLAMLALFGAPHLDDILRGYDEAAPLRAGWRDRVPAHQLHPLAVHAASHGPAYAAPLAAAAEETLDLG